MIAISDIVNNPLAKTSTRIIKISKEMGDIFRIAATYSKRGLSS